MKRIYFSLALFTSSFLAFSQETISPAAPQSGTMALVHGTLHIGNGQVIEDGLLVFTNGKITDIGPYHSVDGMKTIDCSGKQVYPGLISPVTHLGLVEVSAVPATNDQFELGDINPNIRSLVAYNTDSKIIDNVRSNGVLLANVIPEGGIISGTSSVMQLDAWNWEDAVYLKDGGIHFNMPNLFRFSAEGDPVKNGLDAVENVRVFLKQAKAYLEEPSHEHKNLKFESVRRLFTWDQTFFVHADLVREMMIAVDFAREFGFRTVIVGGMDSWKITDYLKQYHIPVILNQMFTLPALQDDDVDMAYKLPFLLQKAGVDYCISDANEDNWYRNLSFNAGVAVAYGLSREQALSAITLNTARILGIDNRTGSLEKGKDANIIVSAGDILDIRTSNVQYAFIQGRQINLDNKQKQLYQKFMGKYGLK